MGIKCCIDLVLMTGGTVQLSPGNIQRDMVTCGGKGDHPHDLLDSRPRKEVFSCGPDAAACRIVCVRPGSASRHVRHQQGVSG